MHDRGGHDDTSGQRRAQQQTKMFHKGLTKGRTTKFSLGFTTAVSL